MIFGTEGGLPAGNRKLESGGRLVIHGPNAATLKAFLEQKGIIDASFAFQSMFAHVFSGEYFAKESVMYDSMNLQHKGWGGTAGSINPIPGAGIMVKIINKLRGESRAYVGVVADNAALLKHTPHFVVGQTSAVLLGASKNMATQAPNLGGFHGKDLREFMDNMKEVHWKEIDDDDDSI